MSPQKAFFYGTLKKGHYNNIRMGLDNPDVAEFVRPAVIKGMTLVQPTGCPYPFALESSKEDAKIEGELWIIHDKEVQEYIERMELGAGYDTIIATTEAGEQVLMYGILEDNHKYSTESLLKNPNFSNFTLKE